MAARKLVHWFNDLSCNEWNAGMNINEIHRFAGIDERLATAGQPDEIWQAFIEQALS
jgi:hypothetical protein